MSSVSKISPAAAVCFQLCDTFYTSQLLHFPLSSIGNGLGESSRTRLARALASK